jgi:hypothetical protein
MKQQPSPEKIEQLGSVSCPSGRMIIIDGGLARHWTQDPKQIDTVLTEGGGASIVEITGIAAIALGGIPSNCILPIMGERIPADQDDCWYRVWIDVRAGVAQTQRDIGRVPVDRARLLIIDADALAMWDDEISQDGLADVLFWGQEAITIAQEMGAEQIPDPDRADIFGWLNLPVADALPLALKIDSLRSDQKRFMLDFRPHTHHWQVMGDVRATPTQSGTMELAGSKLCMFMTSWGDGYFPVKADMDAMGRILRVTIEFGYDDELP